MVGQDIRRRTSPEVIPARMHMPGALSLVSQAPATSAKEGSHDCFFALHQANVIVATGASQFEVLAALVQATGVAWDKCNFFHLDEYIGIAPDHGRWWWWWWWAVVVVRPRACACFVFLVLEGR